MSQSKLCKACEIFNICHEPQKRVAKACQHFKGEIPNGFMFHYSSVAKLVYKKGFADKIAYLDKPSGKVWLSQYELNDLRKKAEQ